MRKAIHLGSFLAVLGVLSGCGQTAPVEVVDLNRVLDVLVDVLESPLEGAGESAQLAASNTDSGAEAEAQADIVPIPDDPDKTRAFLQRYAEALNAAELITSPIGVHFQPDGSIEGFADYNQNSVKEGEEEPHLFRVQIDIEGSRLIASDESGPQHYHRDREYRYRPGGLFMGYMLGSMLGRQNGFYQSSGVRPGFRSMQMSPANYHTQAVSQAKTRARTASTSSARSRSGSGGFRFGK